MAGMCGPDFLVLVVIIGQSSQPSDELSLETFGSSYVYKATISDTHDGYANAGRSAVIGVTRMIESKFFWMFLVQSSRSTVQSCECKVLPSHS